MIDAVIMAILVSSALSLIGVKYAIIIGVLSGIGNLIPYVGPVVAYGSTILVCLISGDFRRLLVAIVVLFVIQTIDGNIINPRLLSTNVDVHPVLVIAALIVGGAIGGIVGMLFAVPVAAFFKIQFEKVIDRLLIARFPEKEKKAKRRGHASDGESVRTSDLKAAPEKAQEQEAADQNGQSVNKPLTDAKKANVKTGTKTGSGAASTAVKKKKTRRTTASAKSTAARSGKTAGAAVKARTEAKAAPDDAVKAAKGGNNSGSAENSKS